MYDVTAKLDAALLSSPNLLLSSCWYPSASRRAWPLSFSWDSVSSVLAAAAEYKWLSST